MSLDTLSGLIGQTIIRVDPCGIQTSEIKINNTKEAAYMYSYQTDGYTLKVI